MALLEVRELQTHFFTRDGVVRAVDGVSFAVDRGSHARDRRRVGLREVGQRRSRSWASFRSRPRSIVGGEVLFGAETC